MNDTVDVLPPAPPLVVPPSSEPVDVKLLKLDLGCGQTPQEGFEGVDIAAIEGVAHVWDLTKAPWPFEDNSVDEARSSHFLEHLDGPEQILFMNELWRVLKPGSGAIIITPHGNSVRAWQDPTHKRPIHVESYLYYSKGWREANKLTHGPYATIRADFDIRPLDCPLDPFWATRSQETQAWAARSMLNVIPDLHMLVIKIGEAK